MRACVKTECGAVDACYLAGCRPDGVAVHGPEYAGFGGGRGNVLCGSFVEVEIRWAFLAEGFVKIDRVRTLGAGCHGA